MKAFSLLAQFRLNAMQPVIAKLGVHARCNMKSLIKVPTWVAGRRVMHGKLAPRGAA